MVQILGVLGVLAVKNALSDDAAAMSEPTAAHVKLQRHAPLFPPAHCASAAVIREVPARHFSGSYVSSDISAMKAPYKGIFPLLNIGTTVPAALTPPCQPGKG
ncbi:MAG: hypothetical protein R3E39_23880 [Anaerolineae bacterium]